MSALIEEADAEPPARVGGGNAFYRANSTNVSPSYPTHAVFELAYRDNFWETIKLLIPKTYRRCYEPVRGAKQGVQ